MLLEQLVAIILNADDSVADCQTSSDETSIGLLDLSVLVNLCHKNFVVLFLLMRSVNISQFTRKIKNFGMLATKMLIILSEDMHAPSERELHNFLRLSFVGIDGCIKHWNVTQLRHIVEFLLDSKEHCGLHNAMLSYEHYFEDMERLLNVS